MSEEPLTLTINGKSRLLGQVPDAERLLDTLRWRAGLKGTKEGCRTGGCGACTVLINGEPALSCLILSREVTEDHVTTIEGVAAVKTGRIVIKAFAEAGAVQCGYCTPGFVMALSAQLGREGSTPSVEALLDGLEGNLCRCTGYRSIQKAVEAAREALR
ncbi:MAG: 2Fe-2S iron-sulfur cluster-binding protein [Thermoplasmata archaeon]